MKNSYTKEGLPDIEAMLRLLDEEKRLVLDWTPIISSPGDLAVVSFTDSGRHFYRVFIGGCAEGCWDFGVERFIFSRGTEAQSPVAPEQTVPSPNSSTIISIFQTGGFEQFTDAVVWCELDAALEDD